MRWVVAALVLVALLPAAQAQAKVDVNAIVDVGADGTATLTAVVSGMPNGMRFPSYSIPKDATFLRATDADGSVVSHVVAGKLDFTSRGKPVSLVFQLAPAKTAAIVTIDVSPLTCTADGACTLGIRVPPTFGVMSAKDHTARDPVEVDASGVFRTTGGGFFSYVVTTDGALDLGPDPAVSGNQTRRHAFANVSTAGSQWTIVTTYDTDVFGQNWTFPIPDGAQVVRATSPFGALETSPDPEGLKVRTPYPFGHGLGARSFALELLLRAPESYGGPFVQANFSLRAAPGDDVSILASAGSGLRYAGARTSGGDEAAPMRYDARGPLSVSLAFLPPAAPGHEQFEEGLFIVDAPASQAAAARATARNASYVLPTVASFVHDAADARPFYVAYTDADIFSWEEGFYSNGMNTISIRASTLGSATDGKPHLVPVGVLVHEATHGLIDRRLPDAPHDLSFLHEGLARLAETQTEAFFAGEVVQCRQEFTPLPTQHCDRHSARPAAEKVRDDYRSGAFSFDVAWRAGQVPDGERGALYDHSGFVLHAFSRYAPDGALRNAIAHIERTRFDGTSADSAALLDILLANAPGASAQTLLYPGASAASLTLGQFQHCLSGLVAPPYPWQEDDIRAPPGGCPATGYGSRAAALPAPPPETDEPTPTSPTTVRPPPPRISPPVFVTPPEQTGSDEGGEIPGAVVEPSGEPRPGEGTPQIVVPGLGPVSIVAALGALAVARRLR